MKVLIVDDSSTIRRILINALGGGKGLEILEAGDGLEGELAAMPAAAALLRRERAARRVKPLADGANPLRACERVPSRSSRSVGLGLRLGGGLSGMMNGS